MPLVFKIRYFLSAAQNILQVLSFISKVEVNVNRKEEKS
jgi:hypothetical protein